MVAIEAGADGDFAFFRFLGADDEHVGNLIELGPADLGAELFSGEVGGGSDTFGFEFIEYLVGVVGDLVADRENTYLLGR